ncbi:hypothetical protein [Nitrosomonas oligotropha]|uniref:Uncharacterized protein n=1 Tax=Nitrosomonas oligotropha TaxID=42354 RepID=A0A1H8UIH1_9PROT|nr:hypothetical protein [Nitrosomonas oligotropha]SDX46926.1 hypothetical protein SAMN05216300_1402 [Nitrosomonas oligotropha]SEP02817.1 hypothetical protein SAMN05216333_1362 [Nitrosomonas oligotropha]
MKFISSFLLVLLGLTGCASSIEKPAHHSNHFHDVPRDSPLAVLPNLPKHLEDDLKKIIGLEGKNIAYALIIDINGQIKALKSVDSIEKNGFPILTNKILDANSITLITHEGSTCVTKVVNGMSRTVCSK